MRKKKLAVLTLVLFGLAFAFIPAANSEVGTYTFHGAAGDQKILKVTTVDNTSLNAVFGANWTKIISVFGGKAYDVGAQSKSVVTAVNNSAKYQFHILAYTSPVYNVTNYTTNNWFFTTGDFKETPDTTNVTVTSFYHPKNLTSEYQLFGSNVSLYNAGIFFAQLPTPVIPYLLAITWQTGWEAANNTIVHHALVNEYVNPGLLNYTYQFKQNCTETWIYDTTYGSWIGYRIQNSTNATIYEFAIQLPGIPGYNPATFIGFTMAGVVAMAYVIKRRMQKKL